MSCDEVIFGVQFLATTKNGFPVMPFPGGVNTIKKVASLWIYDISFLNSVAAMILLFTGTIKPTQGHPLYWTTLKSQILLYGSQSANQPNSSATIKVHPEVLINYWQFKFKRAIARVVCIGILLFSASQQQRLWARRPVPPSNKTVLCWDLMNNLTGRV